MHYKRKRNTKVAGIKGTLEEPEANLRTDAAAATQHFDSDIDNEPKDRTKRSNSVSDRGLEPSPPSIMFLEDNCETEMMVTEANNEHAEGHSRGESEAQILLAKLLKNKEQGLADVCNHVGLTGSPRMRISKTPSQSNDMKSIGNIVNKSGVKKVKKESRAAYKGKRRVPVWRKFFFHKIEDEKNRNIARLIQTDIAKFKQEVVCDASDVCFGNNTIALMGSKRRIRLLELMLRSPVKKPFPYSVTSIPVPKGRPYTMLYSKINFVNLYKNSSILERQQLALDPFYITDCGLEPTKPKVLHVHWYPNTNNADDHYVILINTFGLMTVYKLRSHKRKWKELQFNFNNVLMEKIFPVSKIKFANISTFSVFKQIMGQYWVTNVLSEPDRGPFIFYMTTDSGHIVAVKVSAGFDDAELYAKIQTSLSRITFARIYRDIIIASDIFGRVQVFRVEHATPASIVSVATIWDEVDRCTLFAADFIPMPADADGAFCFAFSKTNKLIVCHLSKMGNIISKQMLEHPGIRITGLAAFGESDLLVSTYTGRVHRFELFNPMVRQLEMVQRCVKHRLHMKNRLLLGMTRTRNKNLYSFVMYRNRQMTHNSRLGNKLFLVSTCLIRPYDYIATLRHRASEDLSDCMDVIKGLSMNLFRLVELKHYMSYCTLTDHDINNMFEPGHFIELRLKTWIARTVYNAFRTRQMPFQLHIDLICHLNTHILQTVHIVNRLRYMQMKIANGGDFFVAAISCLRSRLMRIRGELEECLMIDDYPFNGIILQFIEVATPVIDSICDFNFPHHEACDICQIPLESGCDRCTQGHVITRCSISFVQTTFAIERYCDVCNSPAASEEKLRQIYEPEEEITCLYCRYPFENATTDSLIKFVADFGVRAKASKRIKTVDGDGPEDEDDDDGDDDDNGDGDGDATSEDDAHYNDDNDVDDACKGKRSRAKMKAKASRKGHHGDVEVSGQIASTPPVMAEEGVRGKKRRKRDKLPTS